MIPSSRWSGQPFTRNQNNEYDHHEENELCEGTQKEYSSVV